MNFNQIELDFFLKDKPFFRDRNAYCIGNTMAEAGKIFQSIVGIALNEEDKKDVGMVDAAT